METEYITENNASRRRSQEQKGSWTVEIQNPAEAVRPRSLHPLGWPRRLQAPRYQACAASCPDQSPSSSLWPTVSVMHPTLYAQPLQNHHGQARLTSFSLKSCLPFYLPPIK